MANHPIPPPHIWQQPYFLAKHRYLPSFTFRKAGLDFPSAVDPIPPPEVCVCLCMCAGGGGDGVRGWEKVFQPLNPPEHNYILIIKCPKRSLKTYCLLRFFF